MACIHFTKKIWALYGSIWWRNGTSNHDKLRFFEYYINAHELGHQWWGDNVTCKGWADIWINEGFASYTEHLVAQYLDPTNFLPNLNAAHNSVMSQPGGSVFLQITTR